MLCFDPSKRISAEEALKAPYFDEIRIEENEDHPPDEISLPFDEADLNDEELKCALLEALSEDFDLLGLFE
jgi:serine/threonine protein kinase